MGWPFLSLALILSFPAAVFTITTTPRDTGKICASSSGSAAESDRSRELQLAFGDGSQRRLDLVFIIDRSKSIGLYEFNETKQLIARLTSVLSRRRTISVLGSRTRVAVVSFGVQATSEFDGVSDAESAMDACLFTDRLQSLELMNNETTASQIPAALSRAADIFGVSRSRRRVKQILWVFFDGAEGRQLSYRGTTSADWAAQLRRSGVAIFTVGVGVWIYENAEREKRVSELATSLKHHACIETWLKVLDHLQEEPVNSVEQRDHLYVEASGEFKDKCGFCVSGLRCACDVTDIQYTCTERDLITAEKDKDGFPSWILPVAVSGAVVFLLIIIIVLVCSIRQRTVCTHNDSQRSSQRDCPRDVNLPETGKENWAFKVQVQEDYPDLTNEDLKSSLEQGMEGWGEYLFDQKNDHHLMHLAVYSMTEERQAVTPGFDLKKSERRCLDKLMMTSDQRRPRKLKLAGKTYIIDVYREEVSNQHLHAIRQNRKGGVECAWIAKAYGYLIVGVAEQNEDLQCSDVVYRIHRQLEQ